jgi:DNA replication protein DnaC
MSRCINEVLGNIDLVSFIAAAGAQPNKQGTEDISAQFGKILGGFIDRHNNMIMIGNPGTGKAHQAFDPE